MAETSAVAATRPQTAVLPVALEPVVTVDTKASSQLLVATPASLPTLAAERAVGHVRPLDRTLPLVGFVASASGLAGVVALHDPLIAAGALFVGAAASAIAFIRSGPVRTQAASTSESTARALRMALETGNGATVRLDRALEYVHSVDTISGDTATALLEHLPRGEGWGEHKKSLIHYLGVMHELGFKRWRHDRFEYTDIEVTMMCLAKLGPVTDAQRAKLSHDALANIRHSKGFAGWNDSSRAAIQAAARELIARAPSTTF